MLDRCVVDRETPPRRVANVGAQIPEFRLVSYLITSTISCLSPHNIKTFSYDVHSTCGPNGSFYVDLCTAGFNTSYERFWLDQKFEPEQFDAAATHFSRIAPELANVDRVHAQAIADSWLKRDIVMDDHNNRGDVAALTMLKRACHLVQKNSPRAGVYGLAGSDYYKLGFDRLTYEVAAFLYDQCKSAAFQGCYNPVYRFGIDTVRAYARSLNHSTVCHDFRTHTCLPYLLARRPPNSW